MERNYKSLKIKAIEFRKDGLSYGDIRKRLNVSKSTLSFWLKSITLSPELRKKLYARQVVS
jgi:orotate phosphoribosyltransferase-like protein